VDPVLDGLLLGHAYEEQGRLAVRYLQRHLVVARPVVRVHRMTEHAAPELGQCERLVLRRAVDGDVADDRCHALSRWPTGFWTCGDYAEVAARGATGFRRGSAVSRRRPRSTPLGQPGDTGVADG
jgi:hypothetical protein